MILNDFNADHLSFVAAWTVVVFCLGHGVWLNWNLELLILLCLRIYFSLNHVFNSLLRVSGFNIYSLAFVCSPLSAVALDDLVIIDFL